MITRVQIYRWLGNDAHSLEGHRFETPSRSLWRHCDARLQWGNDALFWLSKQLVALGAVVKYASFSLCISDSPHTHLMCTTTGYSQDSRFIQITQITITGTDVLAFQEPKICIQVGRPHDHKQGSIQAARSVSIESMISALHKVRKWLFAQICCIYDPFVKSSITWNCHPIIWETYCIVVNSGTSFLGHLFTIKRDAFLPTRPR